MMYHHVLHVLAVENLLLNECHGIIGDVQKVRAYICYVYMHATRDHC